MNIMQTALGAMAVAGALAAPAIAQEGKEIQIGTMTWEDLTPITGITKAVLEKAGYTVEVTEFSEWGIAFSALTNGDVDIMVAQADYAAHDYWDRFKDDLEKISPVSHGLYQALVVPSYVPVGSMEELNAHAEQFGGKIVGIEPGSGLMQDAAEAVDAYGLELDLVEGSTAAMTAALQSAIEREEWIVAAIWTPSWMMEKFDVKFLADPKGVFPSAQSYYWIGRDGFSAEQPHAREQLASVYVPLEDILSINGAVADGATMDQAVADWMAAHEDLVGRWSNLKAE
ncbi:glycine betaine ABC transporter substrate-binding protein [Rubellimicrobium aerolatum]|uniref:Glycine betaine ABC transporter substrate-binding protein n=1 Tax=Rubellimicrobium aerolatum TaxID=490979 RepID=A0ABW0SCM2_9RHOB|nr:glycine betaine ABC transporter substrate-binding protein [Rubellimicrobium aerolatum]MBP1806183.1 glycine betaine/proline transport system substrate-binding protein [Rubellimicrobium aerolatum]